jgi:hypothetical protein
MLTRVTNSRGYLSAGGARRSDLPELEGEHFFDPFLTCDHPGLDGLRSDLESGIESAAEPRQRARRNADAETHGRLIAAIAANLAYPVVAGYRTPVIAIPLRKPERGRSRYEPHGFRLLPQAIAALDKAGIVKLAKSRERGRASTIKLPPRCIKRVRRLGLDLASFGHSPEEETIVLARTTTDYITQQRDSERIDYQDSEETRRIREEMSRINQHLAAADISYEGPQIDSMGRLMDASPRSRFLHRTFNIPVPPRKRGQKELPPVETHDKRFDRGGRLYHRGVFWQGLGKEQRRFIRINGEPIAYFDFKSMFLRLAHIEADLEPPDGDLYLRIAGIKTPEHRDGIKKVVNAMLFREGELRRLPRGTKALLPRELQSARTARAAILNAFPGLRTIFERARGFHLMFAESQLLVVLMLRLIQHGIIALPVHDGAMIAESQEDQTKALIHEVTYRTFGVALPLETTKPENLQLSIR